MEDVKHIVITMNTSGEGDTPASVEEILRGYFKKGFVLFSANVLSSTSTSISWAYVLTKSK